MKEEKRSNIYRLESSVWVQYIVWELRIISSCGGSVCLFVCMYVFLYRAILAHTLRVLVLPIPSQTNGQACEWQPPSFCSSHIYDGTRVREN